MRDASYQGMRGAGGDAGTGPALAPRSNHQRGMSAASASTITEPPRDQKRRLITHERAVL
jgi:hypothetical protein